MMQDYLPQVLQHPRGSLAMNRALKQIKELLDEYGGTKEANDPAIQDRINASIDDVESMIELLR